MMMKSDLNELRFHKLTNWDIFIRLWVWKLNLEEQRVYSDIEND